MAARGHKKAGSKSRLFVGECFDRAGSAFGRVYRLDYRFDGFVGLAFIGPDRAEAEIFLILLVRDLDDVTGGDVSAEKVFGEGIAVLAGDALLTQSFELLTAARGWPRYSHRDLVRELAVAGGSLQLIAGQVADLEGEGRDLTLAQLRYIHERKTSALLRCAARFGGMSANCTPRQLEALTDFGTHVGLAFQVIDDILDVTQTTEQLGKTAGKDEAVGKATYPRIVGLERSRLVAAQLTDKAFAALRPFQGRATALDALARHLLERDR